MVEINISLPPPAAKTPEAKLIRNLEQLCLRIHRGKHAAFNRSVKTQQVLSVLSILLSGLGSAGLVAKEVAPDWISTPPKVFWGSLALVVVGLASQVANYFRIAQLATDSEGLARACSIYEERLSFELLAEDPRTAVGEMLTDVVQLFQRDNYNAVLPDQTPALQNAAMNWAASLVAKNRDGWKIKVLRSKRPPLPPPSVATPVPTP